MGSPVGSACPAAKFCTPSDTTSSPFWEPAETNRPTAPSIRRGAPARGPRNVCCRSWVGGRTKPNTSDAFSGVVTSSELQRPVSSGGMWQC
jgi:hypothetical protein